jgi:hypothetical protein
MPKAMIAFVITLFVAGCSAVPPAHSAPAQCQDNADLTHWLHRLGAPSANPLNTEQRMRFLSAYNNIEPVSDFNPESVYLIAYTHEGVFIAILSSGGCIEALNQIPLQTVADWMDEI